MALPPYSHRFWLVGLFLLAVLHVSAVAEDALLELQTVQKQVQALLPKVKPSVVAIRTRDGTASGVIISPDGLILTAAHVAEKPGIRMRVTFDDGKTASALTLGLDEATDAALLRLDKRPEPWPMVPFSRKVSEARPGQWCFAMGHPGGFDRDRGVVLRVGKILRQTANAIQTDCVLMGGDSGGPLFNLVGEVIGIHSQIWEQRDHNMHVSMAPFLRSWTAMQNSQVIQVWSTGSGGYLGAAVDVNDGGELHIMEVIRGSPAEKAGLLIGDVLTALDTQPVRSPQQLSQLIQRHPAGDEVSLQIKRGTARLEVRARLALKPSETEG